MPKDIAKSVADIIINARRVRGDDFARALGILINFHTIAQVLHTAGAPQSVRKSIGKIIEDTTSTLLCALEIDEDECEEMMKLMDTVHEQTLPLYGKVDR
jgi:hypothetical protein